MYTALEDIDFEWEPQQIEMVKKAYSEGLSPGQIASKVKRSIEEVCVLLIDINRKNVGVLYGTMPFDPQFRAINIKRELTKEMYQLLKEQKYKDSDIRDEFCMSNSTLVKLKRAWGYEIKRGGDRRGWKTAERL